jgi:hypothetical protein
MPTRSLRGTVPGHLSGIYAPIAHREAAPIGAGREQGTALVRRARHGWTQPTAGGDGRSHNPNGPLEATADVSCEGAVLSDARQ